MRETNNQHRKNIYLLKTFFWVIAIFLGIAQIWMGRYELSSGDIIAYLDMGDAYVRGDWQDAIHGYFSPVYALLQSIVLHLLHPPMYWEFFLIKLVNLGIFVFSLICFEFFLNTFIRFYQTTSDNEVNEQNYLISEWLWVSIGYLCFLWSGLYWIRVDNDTPDMLVAGIVYLATAILIKLKQNSDSWLNLIIFGFLIGVGYLSKTFMFPMALIFLLTCWMMIKNHPKAIQKVLAAGLIFVLVTSPFIYSLSAKKGYFTFGEAGKLNYQFNFNGIPPRYWLGEIPGSGTPKHPVQQIFDNPAVYYFGMYFPKSTIPIGYDTSFWYEGLISKSNPIKSVEMLIKNIWFYLKEFGIWLMIIYFVLAYTSGSLKASLITFSKNWLFLIPSLTALLLYGLTTDMEIAQPSLRYIAPFIVLLCLGLISSVQLPNSSYPKRLLASLTLGGFLLIGIQFITFWHHPGEHTYWKIAQGLNQMDIQSGDKVAVIKLIGKEGTKDFWARLGRFSIIAEIPSANDFWSADTITKKQIYQALAKTGAKAIIYNADPQGIGTREFLTKNGWKKIKDVSYYVYLFNSQNSPNSSN